MTTEQNAVTQGQEIAPTEQANQPLTEAQLREQAVAAAEAVDAPVDKLEETPQQAQEQVNSGLDTKKLALQVARLEKQLREQKSSGDKTREEYEALVNKLKDPEQRYALLEEHGGTYQDWTNQLVSGTKPQRDPKDIEIDQLKETVNQLISRVEKREETEQQAVQSKSIEKANKYAAEYLETNKDKYPFLHAMSRADVLVSEAVRRTNEGIPVDDDEIASDIEQKLVDAIKAEVVNLSKLDSFDKMLSEFGYQKAARKDTALEDEHTQRDSERGKKIHTTTLTNDLSGEPSSGFDYRSATPQQLKEHARAVAEKAAAEARRNHL